MIVLALSDVIEILTAFNMVKIVTRPGSRTVYFTMDPRSDHIDMQEYFEESCRLPPQLIASYDVRLINYAEIGGRVSVCYYIRFTIPGEPERRMGCVISCGRYRNGVSYKTRPIYHQFSIGSHTAAAAPTPQLDALPDDLRAFLHDREVYSL